jgi:transcriptional regulator with XRE-family HTH domain
LDLPEAAARKLPLNERIVWARKQKGISQERLANEIATSRRHMIRIEKGKHQPGPVFRARIAEATEQPVAFFEDEDDKEGDLPVTVTVTLDYDLLAAAVKRNENAA